MCLIIFNLSLCSPSDQRETNPNTPPFFLARVIGVSPNQQISVSLPIAALRVHVTPKQRQPKTFFLAAEGTDHVRTQLLSSSFANWIQNVPKLLGYQMVKDPQFFQTPPIFGSQFFGSLPKLQLVGGRLSGSLPIGSRSLPSHTDQPDRSSHVHQEVHHSEGGLRSGPRIRDEPMFFRRGPGGAQGLLRHFFGGCFPSRFLWQMGRLAKGRRSC